jgi:hypothetical protein
MFTAQRNAHNDIIVCSGNKVEKGYWVVFTGTFFECNQLAKGGDLL